MSYLKNNLVLLILITFLPLAGIAKMQEFSIGSYDDAKKAESFIRFDMASTKVGLFTSHFSGYVKKFSVEGFEKNNFIENASVQFFVKEMDTDINGRNEKMWDQCLDSNRHPEIKIKILEKIAEDDSGKKVPAVITIRGEEHPITLTVKVSKSEKNLTFDLSGELSLKNLNIPDPSIAIASVRDTVDIVGHFVIEKEDKK